MIEGLTFRSNYLIKTYHILPWVLIVILLVFTIAMCPKKSDSRIKFFDYLGHLFIIVWWMGVLALGHFFNVLSWNWIGKPVESDIATVVYGTFGAKPSPVGPNELLTWPAVSFGVHMLVGVWILCIAYYTICCILHNIKHYE